MSRRALLLATRDTLREQLRYHPSQCEVMFDGRPAPRMGNTFVSVHRGGRVSKILTGLELDTSFFLTLTHRIKEPFDRIGTDLLERESIGMDDEAQKIIELVHGDRKSVIINKANEYLRTSVNEWQFVDPPNFDGDDVPSEKGPDWFRAVMGEGNLPVGLAMTLRFSGATYIRTYYDIDMAEQEQQ